MASSRSKNDHENARDNEVIDSIDALRSIFNLDTPIRAALSSVMGRGAAPPRQPSFSPRVSTSAIKEKSNQLQRPTKSAATTTRQLEENIRALETSKADLENKLMEAVSQKMILESSIAELSELRTRDELRLKEITESRDYFRDESADWKKKLESETAAKHATMATMATMELQRSNDMKKSRDEIQTLQTQLNKQQERYLESESVVKLLTIEVDKLNADLKTRRNIHESEIQRTADVHKKELESLQTKIDQLESNRVVESNKEREAEKTKKQLQQAQADMEKLKEDLSVEKRMSESREADMQKEIQSLTTSAKKSQQKVCMVALWNAAMDSPVHNYSPVLCSVVC